MIAILRSRSSPPLFVIWLIALVAPFKKIFHCVGHEIHRLFWDSNTFNSEYFTGELALVSNPRSAVMRSSRQLIPLVKHHGQTRSISDVEPARSPSPLERSAASPK